MRCPVCSYHDTLVRDSRPSEDGATVRRRRHCPNCNNKFMTFERLGGRAINVIKRNGDVRLFDGNKIIRSIELAARKRPVSHERMEEALGSIVRKLENSGELEVTSKKIGKMVMEELLHIDQVTYVRYASVYEEFKEIEDFSKIIEHFKVGLNE
ncbi:MAG: transcriptional repressor NrdR [Proteobacteria bacterium]|nr:transcriptional repressor NrdR [Pseudomonadota bacterium]